MNILEWIALNCFIILFWLWILCWGGARWVEGAKSIFLIHFFAIKWDSEQIRLYALCILVVNIAWFFAGVFVPDLRFF